MGYGIRVRVQGKRACFTRPEMHTERVSYDVITPSAARGILESVYWKPAISWVIDSIDVLNPIRFETIRRNEIGSKGSYSDAKSVWRGKTKSLGIPASKYRQQRNTLYLVDVDYVIDAHFEIRVGIAGEEDTPQKHYNIALRRIRNGQCFNQPYLGCREFPATVSLVEESSQIPESCYCGEGIHPLGFMLYDLDYSDLKNPQPYFFRAEMIDGRIDLAAARGEAVG